MLKPLKPLHLINHHPDVCLCHSKNFVEINERLSLEAAKAPPITATVVDAALSHSEHDQKPHVSPPTDAITVLVNVRVFDGTQQQLRDGLQVVVAGQTIQSIEPQGTPTPAGATIIDGAQGVLMPGLIDAHWHSILVRPTQMDAMTADFNYIQALAIAEAQATLLRGFTTVRDMGGPVFGLKRAVDEGITLGPRIYPSGAFISQTGGHGDFRSLHEIPKTPASSLSYAEQMGISALADSADEVRRCAREQLMRGASQIKYMAGGGVMSQYDGLRVTEGSVEEIRAATLAAENWGTYVTVHAYTPDAIRMAIAGGVRCIEHGQLLDEATVELMADKGIWWCLQPFLDDEDALPTSNPFSRAKQVAMSAGTDTAYKLAKKHRIKTAWGTDTLFNEHLAKRQGAQLAKLARWYEPHEILQMATRVNGELCALSGPRNPYPAKLGVIEAGAWADLLIVDGNPLEDISLVSRPDEAFVLIMKNGQVVKNTL